MARSGRVVGRSWIRGFGVALLVGLLAVIGLPAASMAATDAPTGTVVAWGSNEWGNTDVPAGLTHVTAVDAGWQNSLALTRHGKVVAWGSNLYGEGEVPADLPIVTAIAAGTCNLALTRHGKVVAWGNDWFGQAEVPADLPIVTAIAAGPYHSLALTGDGTVVAWGSDQGVGILDVPDELTGVTVTAIAAGYRHSLALTSDGKVVAWGSNDSGQTKVPDELTGKTVTAIAAGEEHSLALTSDRTVVAWGSNDSGQTRVPSGLTGVTAIDAFGSNSMALKRDGTLVAWGSQGQSSVPAGLAPVTSMAVGYEHSLAVVPTSPRPDLLVSRERSSRYVGNNVYNTTAAKQTKTTSAKRGRTKTFYVRVANDGNAKGAFTVKGSRPAAKSTVRYYAGSKNITTAIRSAKGWRTTLAPHAATTVKVQVTLDKRAKVGSRKSATVTATWAGTKTLKDTVKAVVVVQR